MKNKTAWRRKLIRMFPVSLFLVITLFFYGPLSLYLPNSQELWFSIGAVMKCILPVSLAVLLACNLAALILPEKISSFLVKLVFGITLGLYLQGNLIGIRYGSGVMDGSPIKWQYYTKYAVVNTGIWLLCLALPFVGEYAVRRLKKHAGQDLVHSVIIAASLFLTAIQIPALAVQALSYKPYERSLTITSEGMFDLADGQNTVLIVLDTMDEQYYADYVKDHPDFTEVLTGFTHYENTLASGARTIVAMPSMLTGIPFKRESTYTEYLQEIYGSENTPLQKIHDTGVSVGIYSDNLYFSDNAMAFTDNFTKDPIQVGSWKTLTKKLYKMTFSRFFPHLLKKYVWFGTSEFKQAMDTVNTFSQNDASFIRQYRKNGFTFREDISGAFRLYHLYGAHPPFNLDAEGNSSKESDLAQQNAGCFTMVREMIEELQQSGHYDDVTIIVTADHGDLNMGVRPFFLLKLPGETGPYQNSSAPLSLFDLPGILSESFGLSWMPTEYGCSLEEVQALTTRERHFFLNTTGSSQIKIVEYMTSGDAGDTDLLEEVQTYEEEGGKDVPYQLGTVLMFDKDATGNKYATEGFAINSGFRTILRGPVARLEIPLEDPPQKGKLKVSIGLHHLSKNRETVILANGEEVFHEKVGKDLIKGGLNFTVPVSVLKDTGNVLTLELQFPELPEDQMELPVQKRKQTISFVTLCIS